MLREMPQDAAQVEEAAQEHEHARAGVSG